MRWCVSRWRAVFRLKDRVAIAVSSAYMYVWICGEVGKSLMYRLKSRGERMEPCGTPACNVCVMDVCLACMTWNVLFVK